MLTDGAPLLASVQSQISLEVVWIFSAYKPGLENMVCSETSDASCFAARSHEKLWQRIWHSQNLIAGKIPICKCREKQQPADYLGLLYMPALEAGGCKQVLHLRNAGELLLCRRPAELSS